MSSTHGTTTTATPAPYEPTIRESPNRGAGLFVGTVFLLLGAIGFLVEDMGTFFSTQGASLWFVWNLNPALVVVWVLAGAALIIAGASSRASARYINTWIGLIFVVFGIAGFFLEGTDVNFLAFNLGDNVTHLAGGLLLLATAVGAERRRR